MFVLDPKVSVNPDKDFDPGPDRWEKQQKLEAFKKRINTDQMPAYFTEESLGATVVQALEQWRKEHESDTTGPAPTPSIGTHVQAGQKKVYLKHLYEDSKHISLR